LIKLELEGKRGIFYQVDMEKAAFEGLHIKIGDELWVRPSRYRSFDE